MNLNKLCRLLRREVTSNPKKATVLGLLIVVALYFWAPVVRGWIAGDEPPDRPFGGASSSPTDGGSGPVQTAGLGTIGLAEAPQARPITPAKARPQTHPWQQTVQWMKQDPATAPVADLPQRRDPFRAAKLVVAEMNAEQHKQEPEPVETPVTPQSLGLILSSTVVGPRRRVALINGKSYEEGRTIESASDGHRVEFKLAEVHSRCVVLERMGERFELAIAQPTRAGRIELFETR